jgi:uncharacterized protein (TIGR02466 family)
MTITSAFSTPIYHYQFEGEPLDLIQQEIAQKIDQLEAKQGPWAELGRTSFNFEGSNDIVSLGLDLVKDTIFTHLWHYLEAVSYPASGFQMADSWFNWYARGEFMYEHIHPNRRVSGCYYYQSTGEDGDLKLRNPNPHMHTGLWPADLMPQQDLIITPRQGLLVLFPSWMWHRVSPNLTDTTRISIAFNLA